MGGRYMVVREKLKYQMVREYMCKNMRGCLVDLGV
jgi:hypothetical protein